MDCKRPGIKYSRTKLLAACGSGPIFVGIDQIDEILHVIGD